MNQENLMHINSNNIGVMDNTGEYQKLFINDLIATSLRYIWLPKHLRDESSIRGLAIECLNNYPY